MAHRHIYATPDDLAQATAAFILDVAGTAVQENGRFTLCLSGGKTPEMLFQYLARPPYREQMPWSNTLVFWSDERCVPANDPRNNAYVAKIMLLDRVNIPGQNILPVPVDRLPEEAAFAYEQMLHRVFDPAPPRFDLILLGMGADGHTASLFPGTPVLNEVTRWVREVFVAGQQMYRVTLTLPLINQAKNVLFLVSGHEKSETLKAVLEPDTRQHTYPAQYVLPADGALYWFLDEAAAASLRAPL